MVISILTLFPEILDAFLKSSIIGKAREKNKVDIRIIDIRAFSADKHKTVDDKPYGGGVGMLLKIDILHKAITASKIKGSKEKVILLDPAGDLFNQKKARNMLAFDHIILICGHYEGIDARIDFYIDEKISIGKYVLTGGEIPALAVSDAITRLLPGVLKNPIAAKEESFSEGFTPFPQYTRPNEFMGHKVPEVLLSGDPKKIEKWKKNG